jgi:hypothetical protein
MGEVMRWTIAGSIGLVTLSAASAARADIVDELSTIPGLTVVAELPGPSSDTRFFQLTYTQPVNHLDPSRGSFAQRLTLLHRSESAPTVAYTGGYGLRQTPFRTEATLLVGGNQLAIEQRFFEASRPEPVDYGDLDIYQAAADHHRIFQALQPLYTGRWLSTGASKGGRVTVYHRRFFEGDVAGSIVYVAPNDVVNDDDRYAEHLEQVGNVECRARLRAVQRAALERRDEIVPVIEQVASEVGLTFDLVGSVDRAFEVGIVELYWVFWQYFLESDCVLVPDADAPLSDLVAFIGEVVGLTGYSDDNVLPFVPASYQAGTQTGYPEISEIEAPIRDLLRYPGFDVPRNFVPAEIPMEFDSSAMADIDRWVKQRGSQLIFVYGQNDPWTAEPFEPGPGTTDAYWYTVPGANHGANLSQLGEDEAIEAIEAIRRWAGLAPLVPASTVSTPSLQPAQALAVDSATVDAINALLHATPLEDVQPFERLHF